MSYIYDMLDDDDKDLKIAGSSGIEVKRTGSGGNAH